MSPRTEIKTKNLGVLYERIVNSEILKPNILKRTTEITGNLSQGGYLRNQLDIMYINHYGNVTV